MRVHCSTQWEPAKRTDLKTCVTFNEIRSVTDITFEVGRQRKCHWQWFGDGLSQDRLQRFRVGQALVVHEIIVLAGCRCGFAYFVLIGTKHGCEGSCRAFAHRLIGKIFSTLRQQAGECKSIALRADHLLHIVLVSGRTFFRLELDCQRDILFSIEIVSV